ncbi:MAG: HIT family protein [Rhodothermales bacterium]|nr:HIT family protein [Rhodothermales bacterium]
MSGTCPFCSLRINRIILETELVVGLWDGYPVSSGHALVVPRRHVETWFELSADEQAAMISTIDEVRARIEKEHSPDAYNIGMNSGRAAGQTVPHAHVHVIPRYEGDVDDPRGGVRWVIPDKAAYWSDSG